MAERTKLIGGPLSGRSIALASDAQVGDIIQIEGAKQSAGNVTVEIKHGYRVTRHPTEGVIGAYVNPADHRRQYGG